MTVPSMALQPGVYSRWEINEEGCEGNEQHAVRLGNFAFPYDAELGKIGKDDPGRSANPGNEGCVVNAESAENVAIPVEADQGINEVIDSRPGIRKGGEGCEGPGDLFCLDDESSVP